jgi:hypothetical protein
MPHRSRTLSVDASQYQDQRFPVCAGGRQGDAYAGLQLPDAHRDLQERAPERFKSCGSPARIPWGRATQFQQQPVGSGVQEQSELVGLPTMAGGAVGLGVEFVLLDPLSGRACLHAREEGSPCSPESNRPFRKDACCVHPPGW